MAAWPSKSRSFNSLRKCMPLLRAVTSCRASPRTFQCRRGGHELCVKSYGRSLFTCRRFELLFPLAAWSLLQLGEYGNLILIYEGLGFRVWRFGLKVQGFCEGPYSMYYNIWAEKSPYNQLQVTAYPGPSLYPPLLVVGARKWIPRWLGFRV